MEQKIIMLADDDSDDREMFCEALAEVNDDIICHCSGNGSELLKKLDGFENEPSLIFLDLNMPIMGGWECLRKLKKDQRYRHIPVIMISTSSHQKEMDTAMELGALCYFVKPSNFTVLMHVLEVITANLGTGLRDALLDFQVHETGVIFNLTEDKL